MAEGGPRSPQPDELDDTDTGAQIYTPPFGIEDNVPRRRITGSRPARAAAKPGLEDNLTAKD
jgi:hypothetical protein